MASDLLKVTPVLLEGAEFRDEPDEVVGGYDTILDITLTGPAPAGGLSVTFESSNTIAADHPAAVVIPEGDTTFELTVPTNVVMLDTATRIYVTQVISASWTRSVDDNTDVLKHLIELSINPKGIAWTDTATGTIEIPDPAPAGGLKLYPRTGSGIDMPNSVTIPEGSTTVDFLIDPTIPSTTSSLAYRIRLVKQVGGSYYTVEDSYIYLKPLLMTGVSLNPDTVTGGDSSTITVTMNGPAPVGGYQIDLSSTNTSVATVTGTVFIPEGDDSIDVTVNTSVVGAATSARIIAIQNLWGGRGYSARLYVNP
jgi:hypothetical protein